MVLMEGKTKTLVMMENAVNIHGRTRNDQNRNGNKRELIRAIILWWLISRSWYRVIHLYQFL